MAASLRAAIAESHVRSGPIAFILHRKKQRAFSPISKALVLLLLLGSDRQSRQLIEQRLGFFRSSVSKPSATSHSSERADSNLHTVVPWQRRASCSLINCARSVQNSSLHCFCSCPHFDVVLRKLVSEQQGCS